MKKIKRSMIQERNGICYEVNQEVPFTGAIVEFYDDGQRELSVQYKNGKRDGLCISYFENGQIKGKAQWKDGGPDVEWLRYYENGKIRGNRL